MFWPERFARLKCRATGFDAFFVSFNISKKRKLRATLRARFLSGVAFSICKSVIRAVAC